MQTLVKSNSDTDSCRSRKAQWFAHKTTQEQSEYLLSDDERSFFRQVLMTNGASRGQIQTMIG